MYGENLYYYDVNSIYPFAMMKDMPLSPAGFTNSITQDDLINGNFFGFCLADIECPKDIAVPLLPFREHKGESVYFPTGKWQGIYFSEILKEVMKQGYKVTPINGYPFHKANLFKDYIDHFYDIKKNSEGATRIIAKMHLNQLYGYFGRSLETIITINVTKTELKNIGLSHNVESVLKNHDDLYVVLLKGNLNHELLDDLNKIREDLDINYNMILNPTKNVKSNVAIAAAVTAYAQIEMMKYKTLPNVGIYYTDTDSIIMDKPLPNHLEGKELGQMKNELGKGECMKMAIFLGNKRYAYVAGDKTFSIFSGAKRNSLSFIDFIAMCQGEEIVKECGDSFVRNLLSLDISIKPRKITLRRSYDKQLVGNHYIPNHINQEPNHLIIEKISMKHDILKWLKKALNLRNY